MIRSAFALALVLVGAFTLSTPAVFAQENAGSLDPEHTRRPPVVLPPAAEVEKDAAQAAEEIEARTRAEHRMREHDADPSRPDLDPDVTQGVQSRGLHDIFRR